MNATRNDISRRTVIRGAAGLLTAAATGRMACAEAYPTHPIKFICPWPPGGTADANMRSLVHITGRELGGSIVFENRSGAAGMLGADVLASAKPDGYTIGMIPLSVARFAQLGKFPHDPLKDFTFIARAVGQTFGIAVRSDSPFKSIAGLVAAAKAKPGDITYATAGIGGQTHIGMEEFRLAAGINLTHIPYKGGSEALEAVLGGHVDLLADSSSWAHLVQEGKMRLLATWSEARLPDFPDAPTLKELGYNVVMNAPNGIGAPAGLPPDIISKLRSVFRTAILSPEYKQACDKLDMVVMYQDADDYRSFVADTYKDETRIIEQLHLRELLQKS